MSPSNTVTRKSKRTGWQRQFRKMKMTAYSYAGPVFRYSLVPGLLLYSIYYTEPQPTLTELLNPFF